MISLRPYRNLAWVAGAIGFAVTLAYVLASNGEGQFYQRSPLMWDLRLEAQKDPVSGRDTSAVLLKHYPAGTDKQVVVTGLLNSGFQVLSMVPCKAGDYDACELVVLDASHQRSFTKTSHRVSLVFAHGKLTAARAHIGLTGI